MAKENSLLTEELRQRLPPLYSQEGVTDPIVQAKFYFPAPNGWIWYAYEGSPVDADGYYDTKKEKVDFLFFGFVVGFEQEIGYFSLSELESVAVPIGTVTTLKIIRDDSFKPMPFSAVKRLHRE